MTSNICEWVDFASENDGAIKPGSRLWRMMTANGHNPAQWRIKHIDYDFDRRHVEYQIERTPDTHWSGQFVSDG
jgi:hypothetical protein